MFVQGNNDKVQLKHDRDITYIIYIPISHIFPLEFIFAYFNGWQSTAKI